MIKLQQNRVGAAPSRSTDKPDKVEGTESDARIYWNLVYDGKSLSSFRKETTSSVLIRLAIYVEKKKKRPLPYSGPRINSRWIFELNIFF